MPAQMIYSMAKKAGVSTKKAEEYWSKAKKIAGEEGRDPDKTGKEKDYKYVTGIVKKMMGIKKESSEEAIERIMAGESVAAVLEDIIFPESD